MDQALSARTSSATLVGLLVMAVTLVGCGRALGGDRAVPPAAPLDSPRGVTQPDPDGVAAGSEAVDDTSESDRSKQEDERADALRAVSAPPPGPGAGVVRGRLIDDLRLPIADAVVALVEPDRRTITAPDGSFRFDGVASGPVQVVFGPAPYHVPQSAPERVAQDGLDLGLVRLPRASAPTLITPDHGGIVPGCDNSRLAVATGAMAEATELRLTCVDQPSYFPAPPPAGRLPMVVLDIAPHGLDFTAPAELEIALPAQPRFADGVALDLLRLDLYSLDWEPAGTVTVTANGGLARGPIDRLGSFIVAAPPFGALVSEQPDEPQIPRYGISDAAGGDPVSEFGPNDLLVYADFEYAGMRNTPILIRTSDDRGNLVFESSRPYAESGSDSAPMVGPNGRWAPGRYQTVWHVGEPPVAVGPAVRWSVLASAPLVPTEPVQAWTDPDPVAGGAGGPSAAQPSIPGSASGMGACPPPKGWFEYVVQPGETVSSLAVATGGEVPQLIMANCLAGPTILAGQRIALPSPPRWPVKPPVGSGSSGGSSSTDPESPGLAQPPITGPNATPIPAKPRDPVEPTVAPRPTEYNIPTRPAIAPVDAGESSGRSAVGSGSVPPTPEPTKVRAPAEPTLASRPTVPTP